MLYFIVNKASKSGYGKKKWLILKHKLNAHSIVYSAYMTKKGEGAGNIVSSILECEAKKQPNTPFKDIACTICVLGGDGTLNEVINATATYPQITLTYLPTGSSNDFARSLHLDADIDFFLCKILNTPTPKHCDLGSIKIKGKKPRYFAVSCGIGFDACVTKEALCSPYKDFLNQIGLGKLTYAAIALKQLMKMPLVDIQITLDNGTTYKFHHSLMSAAFIQPYEGGGIHFAPMANCKDGHFDVCVVSGLSKWRALYLLPLAFFGKHVNAKHVHFYRTTSLTIKTNTPLVVHTDGEYCGMQQEIQLTCHQNALKYI